MAIAASTNNIRVDATSSPFAVTPSDLFDKTFADPAVGFDRTGLTNFKANLSALLPGIASDVQAIPEDPSLRVSDVAKLVALSLAASSTPTRETTPQLGGVTVMSSGALHQARDVCAIGSAATLRQRRRTRAFCWSVESPRFVRAAYRNGCGAGRRCGAVDGHRVQASSDGSGSIREDRTRAKSFKEAAKLQDRHTRDRRVGVPQILRQTALAPVRDAFYKTIGPVRRDW